MVLERVWAASGGPCGTYLAASLQIRIDPWCVTVNWCPVPIATTLRYVPNCWR